MQPRKRGSPPWRPALFQVTKSGLQKGDGCLGLTMRQMRGLECLQAVVWCGVVVSGHGECNAHAFPGVALENPTYHSTSWKLGACSFCSPAVRWLSKESNACKTWSAEHTRVPLAAVIDAQATCLRLQDRYESKQTFGENTLCAMVAQTRRAAPNATRHVRRRAQLFPIADRTNPNGKAVAEVRPSNLRLRL
jgi:hypothetical protein